MDKQLPRRPSVLLELALNDLRLCEQNPDFVIDMETWYDARLPKCVVCLAGSVMAQRLRMPHKSVVTIAELPQMDVMFALNAARAGNIGDMLSVLDYPFPADLPSYVPIPDYSADHRGWWNGMLDILQMLKNAGV